MVAFAAADRDPFSTLCLDRSTVALLPGNDGAKTVRAQVSSLACYTFDRSSRRCVPREMTKVIANRYAKLSISSYSQTRTGNVFPWMEQLSTIRIS